ncbi:MAG TPA: tyrosine-type recombinase/integrase [Gemmatimonadaceae bacterium]|nr:tyrosine-type recombinase/integrase [Gemmatimonadaceae bacterium]
MAKTHSGWSYKTGEKGRNRVRAFEHPSSRFLFLEFYDPKAGGNSSRRKRVALGHRDRALAKQQADEVASRIGRPNALPPAELTLGELFDNYLREVTPRKGAGKQEHDKRAAALFLVCFGRKRKVRTLSARDVERYIDERSNGHIRPSGSFIRRPVRSRVIEYDLRFLNAVLNWATVSGNGNGEVLLERNPLKGIRLPKEESPRRPIVRHEEYEALLAVASRVSWQFELALVLANETGHRISALAQLRWSDVDLAHQRILWRAEHDKIGFEHETPLTPEAIMALETARARELRIGDSWVFPSPTDPERHCSRHLLRDWWQRAEKLAELPAVRGRGYHSLRRKFATEMKDTPLKDLCHLGGWKDGQTIFKCYQQADEGTMRNALSHRKRITAAGG